ncbi:uncharacterized protein LOC117178154 [Belonocnema kinseyi]|uniref:uncharacterized protein LOC117178154 n=1 Tax=Belonocnema kinseyi TaxID=2817044 RepID=UPI00143CD273|nr:uncharacterized protein LOC117178154 [Belonocnema kinseyi]
MAGKRQRKSWRRKLLEEDSEEKLMERRAALQKMLIQMESEERYNFTDTSNGENSESEMNQRTRLGSPFPTARSLSPDSESCDEVNKSGHHGNWRKQSGHHDNWGNKPFYCLPVNKMHPSTSSGYSKGFDSTYCKRRETREDADLFKNLRRSKEKSLSAKPPGEDVWIPLTFLDPFQKYVASDPVDQKSVSRPKNPDLRRRVTKDENASEEVFDTEDFEAKDPPKEVKIEHKSKKRRDRKTEPSRKLGKTSGISESFSKRLKQEVKLEKIEKNGSEPPRKARKIENPSEKTRKEVNSFVKLETSAELNFDSRSRILEREVLERVKQEVKVENLSEEVQGSSTEDFNPLGIIPTDLLFSACVSIAAEIPEEAFRSLKNLQTPKLEAKVEEPDVITIEDENIENSISSSRERQMDDVRESSIDDSESVASNDNIFEAVVKSLIEEKLQESLEENSRDNSRASSEEKNENNGRKKIDFGEEIEKFTIKLRIIKSVEERMKEY